MTGLGIGAVLVALGGILGAILRAWLGGRADATVSAKCAEATAKLEAEIAARRAEAQIEEAKRKANDDATNAARGGLGGYLSRTVPPSSRGPGWGP
jgi:hypothetical protein